ncbi:sugar kinase [Levilactobacillus fujinensis]|uniref:Sugar kinase n=1 Tax=Levilactobacillus fujinensis TaxID=2486024 RepID=A0ABW1TCT4_9LACO|nr:sugar kinase [Levilactobacillus fujinensis]
MAEFLTIGEPMAVLASSNPDKSLVDATDFEKFVAGAELNVAIGVSRLGHRAEYISAVGQDPFGKFIQKSLAEAAIGNDYVSEDAQHWTGFYLKERVTHGDPATFYFRKNSAAANFDSHVLDQIDFSDVKIAHLSGIFAALSENDLSVLRQLNQYLRDAGKFITFDPNLRPVLWDSQAKMIKVTNELAKNADLVMPGINEGKVLLGSDDPETIANFYLDQSDYTKTVIVKLGPKGAYIKQRNGDTQTIPGFYVETVVDTVGAGDGFAVGLITGLLDGLPLDKAARRGCAIGALAVMSPGDNDGYPTPDELTTFMQVQQH